MFPKKQHSYYSDGAGSWYATWVMWFGRCFMCKFTSIPFIPERA